jgi:hypothetical protein
LGALLAAVGSAMAKGGSSGGYSGGGSSGSSSYSGGSGNSGYNSGGGYHSSGYRSRTVSLADGACSTLHPLDHWVP